MSNLPVYRFCDVIGCRKEAVFIHIVTADDDDDDCLCTACYRNILVRRPEIADVYRLIPRTDVIDSQAADHI